MDEVLIGSIVASTLRVSVPLILCALAGVLCERAGVIDLGLEGKMLMTAFAAASVRDVVSAAKPKSTSTGRSSLSRRMLSGLMSRWTIPREWAKARPSASASKIRRASITESGPLCR